MPSATTSRRYGSTRITPTLTTIWGSRWRRRAGYRGSHRTLRAGPADQPGFRRGALRSGDRPSADRQDTGSHCTVRAGPADQARLHSGAERDRATARSPVSRSARVALRRGRVVAAPEGRRERASVVNRVRRHAPKLQRTSRPAFDSSSPSRSSAPAPGRGRATSSPGRPRKPRCKCE